MADNHDLLILPNRGDSSIVLSETVSSLAARGRKDAASLMARISEPKLPEAFIGFADYGDADAQFSIGMKYYTGDGVAKDYSKAAEWFHKAADQDHAAGQRYMAQLYFNGHGLPRDEKLAILWDRKAAENGDPIAQYILGWRFNLGRGVPQDYLQAEMWYRKAAEQDNADAQQGLGSLYNLGHGVPHDEVEAWFWFYLSAGRTSGPRPPMNNTFEDRAKEKLTNEERGEIEKRVKRWFAEHPSHK
jgi:TPR repeat protein